MIADSQLKAQLRRLKLSGILDTLEMRVLESQQNQLDFKNRSQRLRTGPKSTKLNRFLRKGAGE